MHPYDEREVNGDSLMQLLHLTSINLQGKRRGGEDLGSRRERRRGREGDVSRVAERAASCGSSGSSGAWGVEWGGACN